MPLNLPQKSALNIRTKNSCTGQMLQVLKLCRTTFYAFRTFCRLHSLCQFLLFLQFPNSEMVVGFRTFWPVFYFASLAPNFPFSSFRPLIFFQFLGPLIGRCFARRHCSTPVSSDWASRPAPHSLYYILQTRSLLGIKSLDNSNFITQTPPPAPVILAQASRTFWKGPSPTLTPYVSPPPPLYLFYVYLLYFSCLLTLHIFDVPYINFPNEPPPTLSRAHMVILWGGGLFRGEVTISPLNHTSPDDLMVGLRGPPGHGRGVPFYMCYVQAVVGSLSARSMLSCWLALRWLVSHT